MYLFILFILLLLILSCKRLSKESNKESYINFQELPSPPQDKNCPQIHANNYNRLVNRDKLKDFFDEKNIWESESDKDYSAAPNSQINDSLVSAYQMIQPFGYTKNELFDMTRFIEPDIPLPTDPDFFNHI